MRRTGAVRRSEEALPRVCSRCNRPMTQASPVKRSPVNAKAAVRPASNTLFFRGEDESSNEDTVKSSAQSLCVCEPEAVGDEAYLMGMALGAVQQVAKMSTMILDPETWTVRHATAEEQLVEHRSPNDYSVVARLRVACSVDEILQVIGSRRTEDFNASMLALYEDSFAYGVNLRSVPTGAPEAHLSIKTASFKMQTPFSFSQSRSALFLDYVEFDPVTRTARRILQSLKHKSDEPMPTSNSVVNPERGDSLAGFIYEEDPYNKHTDIFVFATQYIRDPKLSSKSVTQDAENEYRSLPKLMRKLERIVMRRRLGRQPVSYPDESESSSSEQCHICSNTFKLLVRPKQFCHLCSHWVCRACASKHDVEQRIGLTERLYVCIACVARVTQQTFSSARSSCDRESLIEVRRPLISLT